MYIDDFNIDFYYKVYVNVYAMMQDRKFTPKKKEMSYQKYKSRIIGYFSENLDPIEFLDNLILIFTRNQEKTMIYWNILHTTLNKSDIDDIYNKMLTKECDNVIIISKNKITSKGKEILNCIKNSQSFHEEELYTNITKHRFNPKFTLLDEKTKNELLEVYKIGVDKLPGIFITDPIVRWYNAKMGDVFRIDRHDDSIYYRTVIETA